jgi:hypothetical protein
MKILDLNKLECHIDSADLSVIVRYRNGEFYDDVDVVARVPVIDPNADELDWDTDKVNFYPYSGDKEFYYAHEKEIIDYIPELLAKSNLSW